MRRGWCSRVDRHLTSKYRKRQRGLSMRMTHRNRYSARASAAAEGALSFRYRPKLLISKCQTQAAMVCVANQGGDSASGAVFIRRRTALHRPRSPRCEAGPWPERRNFGRENGTESGKTSPPRWVYPRSGNDPQQWPSTQAPSRRRRDGDGVLMDGGGHPSLWSERLGRKYLRRPAMSWGAPRHIGRFIPNAFAAATQYPRCLEDELHSGELYLCRAKTHHLHRRTGRTVTAQLAGARRLRITRIPISQEQQYGDRPA